MRHSWHFLAATLAAAASFASAAPVPTADAAALRDLVTSYEQAIRSGDIPKSGIRQRLAPGFSASLPSGELISGYGELSKAENALRTFVGRGTRYEKIDVQVDPAIESGGDLAVLTGRTANRATAQAGKSLDYTTHWTAVARKESGGWRLLRHQAVMDPAANPWHTEEATGPGWLMVVAGTLAGGLAGLIIGMALSKWLSRRPATASSAAPPAAPAAARPRSWESSAPAPTEAPAPAQPASSRSWHAPTETGDPDPSPPADPPAPEKPARKRSWES